MRNCRSVDKSCPRLNDTAGGSRSQQYEKILGMKGGEQERFDAVFSGFRKGFENLTVSRRERLREGHRRRGRRRYTKGRAAEERRKVRALAERERV